MTYFFFVVILGAAALVVLREWLALPRRPPNADGRANEAERRRLSWERRKQGRWMFAAAVAFLR